MQASILRFLILALVLWTGCISFHVRPWMQSHHRVGSFSSSSLPRARANPSTLFAAKPQVDLLATPHSSSASAPTAFSAAHHTHQVFQNGSPNRPSNRRARVGPNKRKQTFYPRGPNWNQQDSSYPAAASSSTAATAVSPPAGRVSVYCVGSKIDLAALRAHVFRRGFGNDEDTLSSLRLTRRAENALLDDEVLHVSNAPIVVSADHTHSTIASHLSQEENDSTGTNDDNTENESDTKEENQRASLSSPAETEIVSEKEHAAHIPFNAVAREQLLMATQDIFYFEYGVVVFWGLSSREEKAALTELAQFTSEPVTPEELEDSFDTMEYVFDHKANPNRPIKFDLMKLRSLRVEEKLAYAYALAQSSKLFVFESKVLQSVERTRYLPKELAQRGKISCSKRELNRLIGQLFVEQTEVNLFSCILDTPDFLWDDDEFLPIYQCSRAYLEVDQRVALLNSRLSVIRELLDVLTAQVADSNSTRLEWIVIWLIAIEIALGIATNPWFAAAKRGIATAAAAIPAVLFLYKQMLSTWEK